MLPNVNLPVANRCFGISFLPLRRNQALERNMKRWGGRGRNDKEEINVKLNGCQGKPGEKYRGDRESRVEWIRDERASKEQRGKMYNVFLQFFLFLFIYGRKKTKKNRQQIRRKMFQKEEKV